ncbi:MAG: ABC transporter substrate-binding protein, partial [Alphaproteobacteria bacterium]|nr:ABC transporter substrate-binding protein [Alphaproteobacteria bacterium]
MIKHAVFSFVAVGAVIGLLTGSAAMAGSTVSHGSSLHGDLKYPKGFKHFDYVNPDAAKGGTVRLSAIGGYDSLNPFILKGASAGSLGLMYDSLMSSSSDEPG